MPAPLTPRFDAQTAIRRLRRITAFLSLYF